MQLGASIPTGPPADTVPGAIEAARVRLGHRPAVTVLSDRGREEQGVASLAQWAAKGAHLLELDLLLDAGDPLRLDAPLSWTSAAVCLAAWWAGVVVTLDGDVEVAVVHETRTPPTSSTELFRLGDAIDGAPRSEIAGEPWVRAVQAFPDQPPVPRGSAGAPALAFGGRTWTQADLLRSARDLGEGTIGVDAATIDPVTGIVAVALRPLVVARPTVVLQGVEASVADGERVSVWR